MSDSESSDATSANPFEVNSQTSMVDKGSHCEEENVLSKQEESLPKLSVSDFHKYNRLAELMSQYVSS